MITILYPCDISKCVITDDWQEHLQRPGYKREYAGTDLASLGGVELPLCASQFDGKVLQAMFSSQGYGYTTFVEYGGVLRVRNAHQKNLNVKVGDIVNPGDLLGLMDSTGNSTGTHDHFEVWLKIDGVWKNIDPLSKTYNIRLVSNKSMLLPLGDPDPLPAPQFKISEIPLYSQVKTSPMVTKWLNLRAEPYIGARDLNNVYPGKLWDFLDCYQESNGNIWFAIKHGTKVGWSAAYYNGETWLVPHE